MKKTLLSFGIACLAFSSSRAQSIEIKNPLDENRTELISIPYTKFSKHFGVDSIFTIKDKTTGAVYVHQLEKLGRSQIQNVLIQVSVASKKKLNLVVQKEQAPSFPAKTFARYVPERFDDFAWENDVVAFRMYGKSLEGRKDDAQGMDYWAKRTTDLVINKWYKEDDYHKDHGQGLDYYSVGQTLGAGDLALYVNGKVHYTKHYRTHQVLDNGPLRTTFKLGFETENIEGNTITFSKTITLDAGKQFNKIVVDFDNQNANQTPIVIGLARRSEQNPEVKFDAKDKTLVYWEPNIQNYGRTGTALYLPKQKLTFHDTDKKQFLIQTSIKNNTSFVYYNGAAWDRAGKIQNFDDWEDFVEDYAESINKPLKVKLKK